MNYRHIYHAGNFADVLKHAVLARIITYLKRKDKAFRVIDSHAGAGLYDLSSTEAQKTGEWQFGIQRLFDAELPKDVAHLLEPYLSVVRDLNPHGRIESYPGSPIIARALFRKQDRLSAIELHPADAEKLKQVFDGDHQTRVTALDGWLALGAHLPPKERRGLVLVDPPFEKDGEYDRLVDGLARACGRWQSGTYCLWYPVKTGAPVAGFHNKLRAVSVAPVLCAELHVYEEGETTGLSGSGVVIVNPPYILESELKTLLPVLEECLGRTKRSSHRIMWLSRDD